MNKKRILIVDDDIPLTQSMKINLEDSGNYEVRVENVSLNAHAAAREFHPDLIMLDIVMPGLDGGDVSALLKSDPLLKDIPVLMVTALVSNDETGGNTTIAGGDQMMVAKPIRFDKLTEAIENCLAAAG